MEGGRYFFNMVREGDQVMFATEDETESTLWVQAIYRATGQSHKPVPPTTQPSRLSNTQLSKEKGGSHVIFHGMICEITIRYDTIRYIYVRSKADEMASLV